MTEWTRTEAFVHPVLAVEGQVGYTHAWRAEHGEPPKYLLIRGGRGTGKPAVLRTFLRTGDDVDLVLTQKQLTAIAGRSATALGATVRYRPAGPAARFRHTPGAVLAVVVAALAWLSTTAAATFAYLRVAAEPPAGGPGTKTGWILTGATVVLAATAIAATLRLVKDVREARR